VQNQLPLNDRLNISPARRLASGEGSKLAIFFAPNVRATADAMPWGFGALGLLSLLTGLCGRPGSHDYLHSRVRLVAYMGPPGLDFINGTWNHSSADLCMSLWSAAINEVTLEVLGPVPRPASDKSDIQGMKVRAWRQHLNGIPEGGIVVLMDAHDTLVLQNAASIERAAGILSTETSVVFSAERNCFPITAYCTIVHAPTSYRYINTGVAVARVGPALRLLLRSWEECTAAGHPTLHGFDQLCIQRFFIDDPDVRQYSARRLNITVDHHCLLFQNAYKTPIWIPKTRPMSRGHPWINNRTLLNPETQTKPCFLHFNGPKQAMSERLYDLYPSASWADHRTRNWRLRLWGKSLRGADVCAAIPLRP